MKGNCGECERRYTCEIDPNRCDEWPDPSPMTNADRIRAMTDEEIARWFYLKWDCTSCSEYKRLHGIGDCDEDCDEDCVKHCVEWLKQPAEMQKGE